ncbi:type II secretion system GspH family protein [Gemmata sp. JC673]|uniref:Type II secretion system GspH family protein n=1 Tax=Gemmata algarum TaxID=2975278 RepID=A0ABU5EWA3_9BACT|nr:type II secretion system protein [Gemmata algarum]MDY3559495.1 type II secretion system GspH family protein [Gemmata algarum]
MTSRTIHRPARRGRAAFTLPELLVVVTVTLILMSILVQATTIITNTVSEAKAQGDFVGQERMAIAVMRRDLQLDHFLEEDGKPNLGRKVSDQRIDQATVVNGLLTYKPPRSGYFWVYAPPAKSRTGWTYDPSQPPTWNVEEGDDNAGFGSSRAGSHFMQFTIVVPGGAPQNTLTADVPMGDPNVITGTCAEVAYFLERHNPPRTTSGLAGAPEVYKLIRRQRLAARNTDDDPAYESILKSYLGAPKNMPPADPLEVIACSYDSGQTRYDVLNLNNLTPRGSRLVRQSISNYRIGEDVLHNYVTSFELKFTGPQTGGVSYLAPATGNIWPRPFNLGNTDYPYDALPFNGEYDTGDESLRAPANLATATVTGPVLKPIRITGIQIRLRCWNPSNKQTRQTTTAVEL